MVQKQTKFVEIFSGSRCFQNKTKVWKFTGDDIQKYVFSNIAFIVSHILRSIKDCWVVGRIRVEWAGNIKKKIGEHKDLDS